MIFLHIDLPHKPVRHALKFQNNSHTQPYHLLPTLFFMRSNLGRPSSVSALKILKILEDTTYVTMANNDRKQLAAPISDY